MAATQAWSALRAWAYRAFTKPASTIGADIEENVLHTVKAKSAFIGANICLGRFCREILVTIFAIRAQF